MGLGTAPIVWLVFILLLAVIPVWLLSLGLWFMGWRKRRRTMAWIGGVPAVGIPGCIALIYMVVAIGFGPFHRVSDRLTFTVTKGMSKAQVIDILGEPNENQDNTLWGYYTKESGFFGILSPVYVGFDAQDKVESVWCQ